MRSWKRSEEEGKKNLNSKFRQYQYIVTFVREFAKEAWDICVRSIMNHNSIRHNHSSLLPK
jgi:hypothetical protein